MSVQLFLQMPDVSLRSIEPPIAIVLFMGCAVALLPQSPGPPRYRCPRWLFLP